MSLRNLLDKNPIQVAAAVVATLNLLVLCHAITMSDEAISAANVALVAWLTLFVSTKTTNTARLNELQTQLGTEPPAPAPAAAARKAGR